MTSERFEVSTGMIDAVHGLEYPTTVTEFRSFLGLCNAFHHFGPNFARTTASLNKSYGKANAGLRRITQRWNNHFWEARIQNSGTRCGPFQGHKAPLQKIPALATSRLDGIFCKTILTNLQTNRILVPLIEWRMTLSAHTTRCPEKALQ